jgi:small neutral amino acid transporter SnatA (MarC family)
MRAMFLAVWTFLSLAVTTIIYAWLGQGGGVAGLIFFGVLLIGVVLNMVLKGLNPVGPQRPRA